MMPLTIDMSPTHFGTWRGTEWATDSTAAVYPAVSRTNASSRFHTGSGSQMVSYRTRARDTGSPLSAAPVPGQQLPHPPAAGDEQPEPVEPVGVGRRRDQPDRHPGLRLQGHLHPPAGQVVHPEHHL